MLSKITFFNQTGESYEIEIGFDENKQIEVEKLIEAIEAIEASSNQSVNSLELKSVSEKKDGKMTESLDITETFKKGVDGRKKLNYEELSSEEIQRIVKFCDKKIAKSVKELLVRTFDAKHKEISKKIEVDYSASVEAIKQATEAAVDKKEGYEFKVVNDIYYYYIPSDEYIVFVTILTGKIYNVACKPDDTIGALKCKIEAQNGASPDQQRIIFAGKQLETEGTVNSYNIVADSTLHLVLKLRGQEPETNPETPNQNHLLYSIGYGLGAAVLTYGGLYCCASIYPEVKKFSIIGALVVGAAVGVLNYTYAEGNSR